MMMMQENLHMKVEVKKIKLFHYMEHFLVNQELFPVDQGIEKIIHFFSLKNKSFYFLVN
jgi:hypothetical protein